MKRKQPRYVEGSFIGDVYLDPYVKSQIEARFTNIVIIQEEADFPVQDDTTIYGEEGMMYYIVKPFTTGKTFIGTNCVVRGITTIVPFWEYTGTGYAMENSLGDRMSIYDINISAPNGTTLLVQGNNAGEILERMNISGILLSGKRIADILGAGGFVFDTSTITIDGSVEDAIFVDSQNMVVFNFERVVGAGIPSNGSVINFGTSTAEEYEITNVIYAGASDGYVFKGLPNSGNVLVGGSFSCEGGNFTDSNTPLLGIGIDDNRSYFYDNNGLDDTQVGGNVFLDEPSTGGVVINTTGVYEEISSGTFLTNIAGKFQGTQRCGLINTSDKDIYATINFTGILDTGGTTDIGIKLYLDDGTTKTEILGSHLDWLNQQARPITTNGYIKIPSGSEVFPKFENSSNTTNFSIPDCQLIVTVTG